MKDKHRYVAKESDLLKSIYKKVNLELRVDKRAFTRTLLLKFALYFPLMTFAYGLLYALHQPIAFICCFVCYGLIAVLFAFNFSHDFSHNTIFKSKQLNDWGFTLIYTIVGAHAEAWKSRHIHSHHYAPNVEDYDSDLSISNLIRVIPGSNHLWFHKYQHWYASLAYCTYSLFWVFVKDVVILFSKDEHQPNKGFSYHLSFWLQKAAYISLTVLFPLFFSKQSLPVVIMGFLAMHVIQSLFLLFTFFMTHHVEGLAYPQTDDQGVINCSWLMNQVGSSNDMHPFSKTANFILGGFNNHIAHHLFPHYHHYYYPAINKILYGILRENGIEPNQTTYWGGIKSHLKLLKQMANP